MVTETLNLSLENNNSNKYILVRKDIDNNFIKNKQNKYSKIISERLKNYELQVIKQKEYDEIIKEKNNLIQIELDDNEKNEIIDNFEYINYGDDNSDNSYNNSIDSNSENCPNNTYPNTEESENGNSYSSDNSDYVYDKKKYDDCIYIDN